MPWNMLQQNYRPHLLLTNATRILEVIGYYLSENTDSRDAESNILPAWSYACRQSMADLRTEAERHKRVSVSLDKDWGYGYA